MYMPAGSAGEAEQATGIFHMLMLGWIRYSCPSALMVGTDAYEKLARAGARIAETTMPKPTLHETYPRMIADDPSNITVSK
jgi:hypothetical protein